MKLPCDWAASAGEESSVTLSRRFNRPSSLETGQAVLAAAGFSSSARGDPFEWRAGWNCPTRAADIAALLQPANVLEVTLLRAECGGESLLEARLEIYPPGATGDAAREPE